MSKLSLRGARLLGTSVAVLGALVAVLSVFTTGATARTNEFPTPRSGPSLSGKPQEGVTLQASSGQWLYASSGLNCTECDYAWQWQRGNAEAFNFVDIAGATTDKYTLTAADVGNRVRIVQTISKIDCDALNQNCRLVSNAQASAPTPVVEPKAAPAPQVAELPKITGTPMEEETLTASTGIWNGQQPISVSYQWYRCDQVGEHCAGIAGATAQTYKLTAADVGFTIRVTGTATNSGGSSFATSEQTPVVAAFGPTATRRSTTIDRVSLPHRLVIDKVTFTPTVLSSRAAFTARIHVNDTRGFWIEKALVQVVSVPFGQVLNVAEVETNARGWATFRLQPTAKLQLKNGGSLVFFLRARKAGENPLAGVSTRRLVQVRLAAPLAP